MEHKLINGGEQWLPFARSRIKALRATGLKYASQKFEVDGCSVRVQIVGEQEFIWLEGEKPTVCVGWTITYPEPAIPGRGALPDKLLPDSSATLRLGSQTIPNAEFRNIYRYPRPYWGVTPYSDKSLLAIQKKEGVTNPSPTVLVYIGGVLQETLENSKYGGTFGASGYIRHTVNSMMNSSERAGLPVYSVIHDQVHTAVAHPVVPGVYSSDETRSTDLTELFLFFGDYDQPIPKLAKVPVKVFSSLSSSTYTYVYNDVAVLREVRGVSLSNTLSIPPPVMTERGMVYQVAQQSKDDAVYAYDWPDTGSGPSVPKIEITTTKTLSTVTVLAISPSGKVKETQVPSMAAAMNTIRTVSTPPGSIEIDRLGVINSSLQLYANDKTLCLYYQNEHDSEPPRMMMSVYKASSLEHVRTIDFGLPTQENLFLYGAATVAGNYLWCTEVCVNIKTGKMLPIPNHMNPRTELDVLGLQDPVNGISSVADYYSFTANGKKATYYWLYITEEDRWRVNALERVNPLKDGHLRSYEIKEVNGVETVVDVSPSPNTKIIGTNKILSGDTNGAALLFKKGGGK